MPYGWHHLAFVYRGGKTRGTDRHWKGRVKTDFTTALGFLNPTIRGGRMQIWLDGKQLVTSASLKDPDNFKRLREPHQTIPYGKKIIFGHYQSESARSTASSGLTGSMSGSICEVALIDKALKKRGINRVINNGRKVPSINVANYPMMLDKDHMHMDREPSTDITTYGSTTPGVADQRVSFTKGDSLAPFNDNDVLVATASMLVGTPVTVAPYLDSPLASKASFTINITPKADIHLTKFNYTGRAMSRSSMSTSGSGVGRGLLRALARQQNITRTAGTFPKFDDTHASSLPGLVRKGGPIPIGDYTGFTYYNFHDGKWEQIGLYDPSSGARIYYDYATSLQVGGEDGSESTMIMSATFPQQFKPSASTRIGVNTTEASTAGYEAHAYGTAGRPSCHMLAPYSQIYHATASQCLRMSDYIAQPFLLERVRISVPVNAYKEFGGDDLSRATNELYPGGASGADFATAGRIRNRQVHHEDNLVFFIYRQTRPKLPHPRPGSWQQPNGRDGSTFSMKQILSYKHPSTVSGSNRFLICSGVACFYNTERVGWDSMETPRTSSNLPHTYEPLHTPAWKYDWGIKCTTSSAEYSLQVASGTAHGVYTGSIIMDIKPAIQGPTTLGAFMVPRGHQSYMRGDDGSSTTANVLNSKSANSDITKLFGSWPGGTTYTSFFAATGGIYRGRKSPLGEGGQGGWTTHPKRQTQYKAQMEASGFNTSGKKNLIQSLPYSYVADGRTRSMAGMSTLLNNAGTPQNLAKGEDDASIVEHPYLLMPEDELVFGMDWLPSVISYAGHANELTGSYVKLLSTGSATVTFYGSFIKEGKPSSPMLNQHLTSDAVHEVVGNEPIYDQFMINQRHEYSGSYIDNIMRGGRPGVRGMFHGISVGLGTPEQPHLVYSGNMARRERWRQSVVGLDYLKVFSEWIPIDRTGSAGRMPEDAEVRIWTFGNTPHGGPVWGVKHNTPATSRASSIYYLKTFVQGLQSGSATSGGNTYYWSCLGPHTGSASGGGPWNVLGLGLGYSQHRQVMQSKMQNMRRPLPISLLRGVRMTTANERYYDSMVPNLAQYAKFNDGAVVMGRSHKDTVGTGRPAISLPHQTSIMRSGTIILDVLEPFSTKQQSAGMGEWLDAAGAHTSDMSGSTYSWAGTLDRAPAAALIPVFGYGSKFIVEPTRRGCWGEASTLVGALGTTSRHNGRYSSAKHRDAPSAGATTVKMGASARRRINSAVWSGSLAFPFEMSPRRSAVNQKYMLTVFTGTDTSAGAIGPNRYMAHPGEIRKTLFRLGHVPVIFGNDSDIVEARVSTTGSAANTQESVYGHHHILVQYYGWLQSYVKGAIKTRGPETVTTGTYAVCDPPMKHVGSCQGFRYGLINTEPMNTTAVYRHDQFGQYRDMLEQRPFARFFKRVQKPRVRRLIRRARGRRSNSVVTQGPVTIKFKSSLTGKRIKAVRTNSQNLSPVATSSLPYFDADRDGKFRNRPYPFDETILDTAIIVDEDV